MLYLGSFLEFKEKFSKAEAARLEGMSLVETNECASNEDRQAHAKGLWEFYIKYAAAVPGSGLMRKAVEWRTRLSEYERVGATNRSEVGPEKKTGIPKLSPLEAKAEKVYRSEIA